MNNEWNVLFQDKTITLPSQTLQQGGTSTFKINYSLNEDKGATDRGACYSNNM